MGCPRERCFARGKQRPGMACPTVPRGLSTDPLCCDKTMIPVVRRRWPERSRTSISSGMAYMLGWGGAARTGRAPDKDPAQAPKIGSISARTSWWCFPDTAQERYGHKSDLSNNLFYVTRISSSGDANVTWVSVAKGGERIQGGAAKLTPNSFTHPDQCPKGAESAGQRADSMNQRKEINHELDIYRLYVVRKETTVDRVVTMKSRQAIVRWGLSWCCGIAG